MLSLLQSYKNSSFFEKHFGLIESLWTILPKGWSCFIPHGSIVFVSVFAFSRLCGRCWCATDADASKFQGASDLAGSNADGHGALSSLPFHRICWHGPCFHVSCPMCRVFCKRGERAETAGQWGPSCDAEVSDYWAWLGRLMIGSLANSVVRMESLSW